MKDQHRPQLLLFAGFVLTYAILGFVFYYFSSFDELMVGQSLQPEIASQPKWLIGLASSGSIILVYGLAGLAGYWLMKRSGYPGIYREDAGWRDWFVQPLVYGIVIGILLVVADRLFATQLTGFDLPHPDFPLSLVASASAGIGEEIMFRFFLMGLWIFLLGLVLKRWNAKTAAFWIANLIAALGFAAGHLPAVMFLFDVTDPFQLPVPLLLEILVLNGLVGLVAGERLAKNGLVAAIGIHFWADVVWHVIWPLL